MALRILYALDYPDGGTWAVASAAAAELRHLGHEVTFHFLKDGAFEGEVDVVHAWNLRAGAQFRGVLPTVQTINSFLPAYAAGYVAAAQEATLVHTHSPYVAQFLQNFAGVCATYVPVAFDHGRCEGPIPLPKEFTLGWLGSDRSFKRFDVARQIAEIAKVPYVEWDVDELHPWEKVKAEFFPAISCYLMASFNDCGPLPPQEALLFGRPVISTCVGMMTTIIEEGVNGLLFDGSVSDGVRAVRQMKEESDGISGLLSRLPFPEDVAPAYLRLYSRATE